MLQTACYMKFLYIVQLNKPSKYTNMVTIKNGSMILASVSPYHFSRRRNMYRNVDLDDWRNEKEQTFSLGYKTCLHENNSGKRGNANQVRCPTFL